MNGFFSATFVLQVGLLIFAAGGVIALLRHQAGQTEERFRRVDRILDRLLEKQAEQDMSLAVIKALVKDLRAARTRRRLENSGNGENED